MERKLRVAYENLDALSYDQLVSVVEESEEILRNCPEGYCTFDPRNGIRVTYSLSRTTRPHDNAPQEGRDPCLGDRATQASSAKTRLFPMATPEQCFVCRGETTPAVDVVPLSSGFTFINENLFPMLLGHRNGAPELNGSWVERSRDAELSGGPPARSPDRRGSSDAAFFGTGPALGHHWLQWTSSDHYADYHNMPPDDIAVGLERLGHLEEKVLHSPESGMPRRADGHYGHFGVIKNVGRLIGGSVSHGHQQMIHTNILPQRIEQDAEFMIRTGKSLAAFLLETNPRRLLIRDFAECVALVPYFAKRPLEAMILPKQNRQNLHELRSSEIAALAAALRTVCSCVVDLMVEMGREVAYNLVFHTGPIGRLYVEMLPWTQEIGGYEQLGIYVSQASPLITAEAFQRRLSTED